MGPRITIAAISASSLALTKRLFYQLDGVPFALVPFVGLRVHSFSLGANAAVSAVRVARASPITPIVWG